VSREMEVDRAAVLSKYPDAVAHAMFGGVHWIDGGCGANYEQIGGYGSHEAEAWLSAANWIDRQRQEAATTDHESFSAHLKTASRMVAKWPAWKQNILHDPARAGHQQLQQ